MGWQFGSLYQTAAAEISYLEEIDLAVYRNHLSISVHYLQKRDSWP